MANTAADVASMFGVGDGPGVGVNVTVGVALGVPVALGVLVAAGKTTGVGDGSCVGAGTVGGDCSGEIKPPHPVHTTAKAMDSNPAARFE